MEQNINAVKDIANAAPAATTTATPVLEEGARGGERGGFSKDGKRPGGPQGGKRRRSCAFCAAHSGYYIDYKDVGRLRKYLTEKGKIISRRQTGLCARHQREITNAIKRARTMSLI